MKRKPPPVCPVCGEDVPPNAQACPECGACHETGWREDADVYDGLDLPDTAYGEEDGENPRTPSHRRRDPAGIPIFWRVIAVLALLATFWGLWKWLFAASRA